MINDYRERIELARLNYLHEKSLHPVKVTKPPFPSEIDEAMKWYYLSPNDGSAGDAQETYINWYLTGRVEKVHGPHEIDVKLEYGNSLESKVGRGQIISPVFDSLEEVQEFVSELDDISDVIRGRYVAYSPFFYGTYHSIRVIPKKRFISILNELNLLTFKSNKGKWGVSIQTFHTSKIRSNKFYDLLQKYGQTLPDFKATHIIKWEDK